MPQPFDGRPTIGNAPLDNGAQQDFRGEVRCQISACEASDSEGRSKRPVLSRCAALRMMSGRQHDTGRVTASVWLDGKDETLRNELVQIKSIVS